MIAYLILVVGFLALCVGALLCFRGRWVLAWLRGTLGLGLVVAALLLIFYGLDLRYYQVLTLEQPVARVLIERVDGQLWQVTVQDQEQSFTVELRGDEWQIDAQVLRWPATWQALGFNTQYRLERLSGRYHSIEQELNSPRTAVPLGKRMPASEWWGWVGQLSDRMGWLDAAYGSSAYHPLVDGAVFEVSLTNAGLVSRPVNDQARDVLADWLRESSQQ